MMPSFSVADLKEDQFEAVWPLVRAASPDITLWRWLQYAHEASHAGGLLGLFGPDGALFGFLTYREEDNLRCGRVLRVDDFLCVELSRAAPARRALCAGAEAIARDKGCAAIEFRLASRGYADAEGAKAKGWANLGHSLESVLFMKQLGAGSDGEDLARQA